MLCSLQPAMQEFLEKAFAQLEQGFYEDAIESFSDYILIEPASAEAYHGRAQASFQLKNWPAAISDFEKTKELNPGNLESWTGLALSLAMENKIYEALGVFEALLADHPAYVRGHILLGQLYYRLGTITKGHEEMDLALASRPSLAERRQIEQLKKAELILDKKRLYRPDFEALQKSHPGFTGLFSRIAGFFRKKL